MTFFPTQQPLFTDNDNQNIMSSSNSTYFREESLVDIANSWNKNIDPLLQSLSPSQGLQAAYQHQQQQRLQSFIDAPPQRALFTAPSYNQQQYAQGVRSLPQASLSHGQRNISPAPSQDFTSSTSTSGHSPDGEPDLSYYSPQQSHFNGDDFLLHQSYHQEDLWAGHRSGNTQMEYHVNMSQVQSFPDTLYEPATDEGFMEMHNHLSISKGEAHYPSEIHTLSNYADEQVHSQGRENGTYHHYQRDEGLGTSIHSAPSPADSTTAYDHEIEEEEDDEEYRPKSTRTRKRAAPSHASISHHQPATKRSRISHSTSTSKPKPKTSKSVASATLQCRTCPSHPSFNTASALTRHVATAHTRPYTCTFSFAGCTSTFASKNEWKRHVSSQHLCLTAWVCTLGQCGKARGGSEFNRKDLFTQHWRRMHCPSSAASSGGNNKTSKGKSGKGDSKYDDELKELQKKCLVQKRECPRLLGCPVSGCGVTFDGTMAWDEMMEHVGKHLDNSSLAGEDEEQVDQGAGVLLVEWAIKEGVVVRLAGGRFSFAKDGSGGVVRGNGNGNARGGSADADAEGELEDGY